MRKITKYRNPGGFHCESENAADLDTMFRKTGKKCDNYAYITVEDEDGTVSHFCGPCYGDVRRPDEPQPWDVIYPKGHPNNPSRKSPPPGG